MSKAFCSLPWIHLATHPHGGASLCCQSEMEKGTSFAVNEDGHDPITLNERGVSDLINSKRFKEVRLSMLKGERHPACSPCWDREDKGLESKRIFDMKRFKLTPSEAQAMTASDGSIKPNIKFLELRLGNTCNIKCVTCNPNSSIAFSKDHEKMIKDPELNFLRDYSWVKPNMSDWTEREEFWVDLNENAPELREIYINGGEPMLIKKHMEFLTKLVQDGRSKNISLTYSINMTRLIDDFKVLWPQFKSVHIASSIDDWDNKNFYIRYPSSWQQVTSNFQKLLDWGLKPHVLQTISVLNFMSLGEFHKNLQGMFPGTVISYNDVYDPPWFSAKILKPEWRREIIASLKDQLPDRLLNQLKSMYDTDEYFEKDFINFKLQMKAFDTLRNTNVKEYFPELEAFLNSKNETLGV